jgi:hypothetical protein
MAISTGQLNVLLVQLTPWLHKRCVFKARGLAGVEPDELFQATVLRFLERARLGWFDQAPTKSQLSQARALLWYCLRQELTAIYKHKARNDLVDVTDAEGGFPGLVASMELRDIDDRALIKLVLDEMESVSTPTCRLSLLSRDVPWLVVVRHVEQAKAQKSGGSKMVVRPAADALQLLKGTLSLYAEAEDLRTWALVLGAIYFGQGPLGSVPETIRKEGATKVERYARRALVAMAEYFGGKEGIA